MLIEIMGPSGVGKSTILDAASEIRDQENLPWLEPGSMSKDAPMSARVVDSEEVARLMDFTLHAIVKSEMKPSQKIVSATLLRKSENLRQQVLDRTIELPFVHDELLLNRAFSCLLYSPRYRENVSTYLNMVPIPDAVVIARADADTIRARVNRRDRKVNVYYGLGPGDMGVIISRALAVCDTAYQHFKRVDVPVLMLNTEKPASEAAQMLHEWITRCFLAPNV